MTIRGILDNCQQLRYHGRIMMPTRFVLLVILCCLFMSAACAFVALDITATTYYKGSHCRPYHPETKLYSFTAPWINHNNHNNPSHPPKPRRRLFSTRTLQGQHYMDHSSHPNENNHNGTTFLDDLTATSSTSSSALPPVPTLKRLRKGQGKAVLRKSAGNDEDEDEILDEILDELELLDEGDEMEDPNASNGGGYLNSLLVLRSHNSAKSSNNGSNDKGSSTSLNSVRDSYNDKDKKSAKKKREKKRSYFDRKTLLSLNDSLNSLNGVTKLERSQDNNDNNNDSSKNSEKKNIQDKKAPPPPENTSETKPVEAKRPAKSELSSTTLASSSSSASASVAKLGSNNKNEPNKAYNQNPKNSQEIIRAIHLRNFNRALEQVKRLEQTKSPIQQQQQQKQQQPSPIPKKSKRKLLAGTKAKPKSSRMLPSLFLPPKRQLWLPLLISGMYATLISMVASTLLQATTASWATSASQPFLVTGSTAAAAVAASSTLLSCALAVLSIPIAFGWTSRVVLSTVQVWHRQQVRAQIKLQIQALARALHQSMDTLTTRKTPSAAATMLISTSSRGGGGGGAWKTQQDLQQQQQEGQKFQDIFVAATCLALVGCLSSHHYVRGAAAAAAAVDQTETTNDTSDIATIEGDGMDATPQTAAPAATIDSPAAAAVAANSDQRIIQTAFVEKDVEWMLSYPADTSENPISTTTSSSSRDRMGAMLERVRRVTRKLSCRDMSTSQAWEERIFALETNLALLQTIHANANNDNNNDRFLIFPLLQSFNTNNNNHNNKRMVPKPAWAKKLSGASLLWMALYPLCLVTRQVHPVAVVGSTLLVTSLGLWGQTTLDKLRTELRSSTILSQEASDASSSTSLLWSREILDTVQQQMSMPSTNDGR